MYPRTNYEMTQADMDTILAACKPTPVMFLSGGTSLGSSPQENANRAWAELGARMGFDWETVRPIGDNPLKFTAVPNETEQQRADRMAREAEQAKRNEVARIESEIEVLQDRLKSLLTP